MLRSVCACLHRVQHTAPDAILQSALFTWATRIQIAQCLVHVGGTEGRTEGRTDRQTPKCSHQPRKSGCCGNGSHCGSSHTRIEGHRCHHPRRTPGHTDKSLHKALCRVLNWMGPVRSQGRLYHRSYNGYSVGRKWLIGERKKNDRQWRTYFYT